MHLRAAMYRCEHGSILAMDTIGGCPIVLHEHCMHLRAAMSDVFSLVLGT